MPKYLHISNICCIFAIEIIKTRNYEDKEKQQQRRLQDKS